MNMNDYQSMAKAFAVFPPAVGLMYTTLGLVNEAGEVAGKVKKELRGDGEIDTAALVDEIGDVLWYVASLTTCLGFTLGDVAHRNINKLSDRAMRGVIKGNGDNR
jgi:NTP pyrophosphatase (non-canonical NTP hydrolase)